MNIPAIKTVEASQAPLGGLPLLQPEVLVLLHTSLVTAMSQRWQPDQADLMNAELTKLFDYLGQGFALYVESLLQSELRKLGLTSENDSAATG